jgi:diguanylate cyclase (GGDEF)-like protein
VFEQFLRLGEPKAANADVRARLRAEQIAAIASYTPWMMAANIVNACIVVAAFLGHTHFARAAIWASIVSILSLFVIYRWLNNSKKTAPTHVSLNAIKRAAINAVILGLLWGSIAPLLYPYADHGGQLVLICVLAGMLCGSGFSLLAAPSAALAFSGAMSIGTFSALVLTPSLPSLLIAGMSLVYVTAITTVSLSLSKVLSGRMLAELESREQRDVIGLLLNDFTENASDWLWTLDSNLNITDISARFADITQKDRKDFIGQPVIGTLPLLAPSLCSSEELEAIRQLQHCLQTHAPFKNSAVPVEVDGQKRVWSFSAKPVFREDGSFNGYRGVGRDLTEEVEAKANIEHLAKYDVLTGLPNRVLFKDEIARAFARLARNDEQFAVLLLDLDHFKIINDTQGHAEGDALLVLVAGRLMSLVRELDTVARLGGDEFAIIMNGVENAADVGKLANRICNELGKPFRLDNSEVVIGVSVGIAVTNSAITDTDTLMRFADLALYRSKSAGRGTYQFFEEEMDADARRRRKLETDLRLGLQNNELELYFQPLVDADSKAVNTFEALVRWHHPE